MIIANFKAIENNTVKSPTKFHPQFRGNIVKFALHKLTHTHTESVILKSSVINSGITIGFLALPPRRRRNRRRSPDKIC